MIHLYLLMLLLLLLSLSILILPMRKLLVQGIAYERMIVLLSAIGMIVLATLLYISLGGGQSLANWYRIQAREAQVKKVLAQYHSAGEVITKLRAHVLAHPDIAKGWYLLGRLYMANQQYDKAQLVLAKAYQLAPDNLKILAQYANSLYSFHQGLTEKAEKLLNIVLKQDPKNLIALNLFALEAYSQQEYETAIRYWEKVLKIYPQKSEESISIRLAIDKAKKALAV